MSQFSILFEDVLLLVLLFSFFPSKANVAVPPRMHTTQIQNEKQQKKKVQFPCTAQHQVSFSLTVTELHAISALSLHAMCIAHRLADTTLSMYAHFYLLP